MSTAIISVDRKRRLSRLLKEGRTVWIADTAAFSQRRGRRALVLPPEEEVPVEGERRRNGRKEKICPVCGVRFKAEEGQRYCSSLCAEEAGEAEVGEAGEARAEAGEVAENHPWKTLHMSASHTLERRGAAGVARLYPPAGRVGVLEEIPEEEEEAFPEAPARRVENPTEIRELLLKVLDGAVKVLAEPGTEPCEREFYLGFTAEDRDAQVGCFIPKLIRRLLVLYSKGLLTPTALFLWEGRGGPALVGLEGTVPARLIGIRGWTGRTSRAEEAVGVANEEGGEDD
jgi:hypothetical protein